MDITKKWGRRIRSYRKQAKEFIESKEKTREFQPNRLVRRVDIEEEIESFLRSGKPAVIVVGAMGVGKTSLLCALARRRLDSGDSLLLCEGAQLLGSISGDVKDAIDHRLRDGLKLDPHIPVEIQLGELNSLLSGQDRYLLIIFDGVEKFRFADAGMRELLVSLNSLIRSIRGLTRVRFILSCVASAWYLLPVVDTIQWDLYYTPRGKEQQPLALEQYTDSEFRFAYEKYIGFSELPDSELFSHVEELCQRDPYLLRLTSELDKSSLPDLTTSELMRTYYIRKILRESPEVREKFLTEFIEKMLQHGSDDVSREILDVNSQGYNSLVREGILVQGSSPEMVRLNHSRLSEYMLTEHLLKRFPQDIDRDTLATLLDQAYMGFYPLWEAIGTYLGRNGKVEVFSDLAGSGNYAAQEMAIAGLEKLGRERPKSVGSLLRNLFSDPEARPVALRAALQLHRLKDVRSEFIGWAHGEQAQAANHVWLLWREYQNTRLGEAIWDELRAIRSELMNADIQALKSSESIRFIASVSWRIFLNHCHEPSIVARLSQFWSETWQQILADRRLGSPIVRAGFTQAMTHQLEDYVVWMIRRFLKEFTSSNPEKAQKLPHLPVFPAEMRLVARLLDYQVSVSTFGASQDALLSLLRTPPAPETRLHVIIPAIAIAVQTLRDFRGGRSTLESLFDAGGVQERLAILSAFSIYAPEFHPSEQADAFVNTISSLTRKLLTQSPGYIAEMQDPWGLAGKWRMTLALAPLGFAYCSLAASKRPVIQPIVDLVRDMSSFQGQRFLMGCIRALAPVGIYFPAETLATLEELGVFDRTEPDLAAETRNTLRIIQVFNYPRVSDFLRHLGRARRAGLEPERLVGRPLDQLLALTQWIGNINFFYHASRFPFLRCLVIGSLQGLTAEGDRADRLISEFAKILANAVVERGLSLERLLIDPVDDAESVIREVAGRGYAGA